MPSSTLPSGAARARALVLAATFSLGVVGCSSELPSGPADRLAPGQAQLDISILAAPTNDDFDNAITFTAVPFTHTVSVAEATAAADDPQDHTNCDLGSFDGHTVWYQFTPSANMRVSVNTVRSVGLDPITFILTGTRGDLTLLSCDIYGNTTLDAVAGTTYYIMIDTAFEPAGGDVVLNVVAGLEVGVTIDPVGRVNPSTGATTISGTVSCSRGAFFELGGDVIQRKAVVSDMFVSFNCEGVSHWEVEVLAEGGRLRPGKAQVRASVLFYDNTTTQEVRARAEPTTVKLVPTAAKAGSR